MLQLIHRACVPALAVVILLGLVPWSFELPQAGAQFRTMNTLPAPVNNFRPGFFGSPFNSGWNPYNPYNFGADPYGGYLNGMSSVISAQGQYLVNTQQAFQIKEQTRSMQLDNRRKTFDQWMYERANTPTLNEERERMQREEVRRSLNQPPPTEIWAGKALNDLLANIQNLQNQGYEGPDVPLSTEMLQNINVTAGRGNTNTSMMRDIGNLNWPVSLQTLPPEKENKALREQIDTLMAQATKQAQSGRVDAGTVTELGRAIARFRGALRDQVDNMSFRDYTEGLRFVRQLDENSRLLQQPDAQLFVSGKFQAQGRDVRELVQNMSTNGLNFAPAASGQEWAYNALHNALVRYSVGANTMSTTRQK